MLLCWENAIFLSCPDRLVEAGGGEELEVSPPYSNISRLTHILSDTKHASDKEIGYQAMANQGVPVVKPSFLIESITSETVPDIVKFLIQEFKPLWQSTKSVRNKKTK